MCNIKINSTLNSNNINEQKTLFLLILDWYKYKIKYLIQLKVFHIILQKLVYT